MNTRKSDTLPKPPVVTLADIKPGEPFIFHEGGALHMRVPGGVFAESSRAAAVTNINLETGSFGFACLDCPVLRVNAEVLEYV